MALTESYYRYRGLTIRSLRENIGTDHTPTSDLVLAGIVTLLLSDVSPFSASQSSPRQSGRRLC